MRYTILYIRDANEVLKPVLSNVINVLQSAFVRDKMIRDNIIIAIVAFHWLKTKIEEGSHSKKLSLELDTSKAYDRVELTYLQ